MQETVGLHCVLLVWVWAVCIACCWFGFGRTQKLFEAIQLCTRERGSDWSSFHSFGPMATFLTAPLSITLPLQSYNGSDFYCDTKD